MECVAQQPSGHATGLAIYPSYALQCLATRGPAKEVGSRGYHSSYRQTCARGRLLDRCIMSAQCRSGLAFSVWGTGL